MIYMERKRLPAIKARIEDISKGKYYAQEGFNPHYVITPQGAKVSRVRVMSTVVDKFMAESGKFASLTLDDGTDTIRSKSFNNLSVFEGIETGDDIELIGNEKGVSDLDELKKVMKERYGIEPEETETIVLTKTGPAEEGAPAEKESSKEKLLKIIAENDPGEGCEYQTLIDKSGMDESSIDAAIQELLDEGSCFEPKPGKIKKL